MKTMYSMEEYLIIIVCDIVPIVTVCGIRPYKYICLSK